MFRSHREGINRRAGSSWKFAYFVDQPFKFSAKRYFDDLGPVDYGYRFYNPSIGKWMSRDPLGEFGGLNLYGFVGNNPANFFDPLGLADDSGTKTLLGPNYIGSKKDVELVEKILGGK